jgi:uncharacterized membrane protein
VIGSRVLLGAGLISLLLGAVFFVQLSGIHPWLPPSVRVLLGMAAGIALLAGGALRLGTRPNLVAEGITGLGASILYVATWAAFGPFHLVGEPLAFAAMVLTSGALALVAWRTRRQTVALFGLTGAFVTPALLAAGPLSPVVLSMYLCVVCGAMLALAVRCGYRFVEVAVFAGAIAFAPALQPDGALHWSANDALLVATVLFVEFAGALLLAARRVDAADPYRIALLVTEVFAYCGALEDQLHGSPHLLAAAEVGLGAAMVAALAMRLPAPLRATSMWLALGVVTRAIAVLTDTHAIGAVLAVEGVGLMGIGVRSARPVLRTAGYAALLSSFCAAAWSLNHTTLDRLDAFANDATTTTFAVIAAALLVLRDMRSYAPLFGKTERDLFATITLLVGTTLALTVFGTDVVAATALPDGTWTAATQTGLTVLGALIASILVTAGFWYVSPPARWLGLGAFVVTVVKMFIFDLSTLGATERIVSALVLGVLLVAVAAWYQWTALRGRQES